MPKNAISLLVAGLKDNSLFYLFLINSLKEIEFNQIGCDAWLWCSDNKNARPVDYRTRYMYASSMNTLSITFRANLIWDTPGPVLTAVFKSLTKSSFGLTTDMFCRDNS